MSQRIRNLAEVEAADGPEAVEEAGREAVDAEPRQTELDEPGQAVERAGGQRQGEVDRGRCVVVELERAQAAELDEDAGREASTGNVPRRHQQAHQPRTAQRLHDQTRSKR